MKFIFTKKENNKKACPVKPWRSGGFALLFSVLVSSLLLTIGLSIFSIALKELAISTATRQSIHAYYAADSGREYAKYRDTKLGNFPDVSLLLDDTVVSTTTGEVQLPVVFDDDQGSNFIVEVRKDRVAGSLMTDKVNTTIISKGYDTKDGDRVERAIFQTY